MNIRGEHIVGSAAIGAGHAGIFTTIDAGSVDRMELVRAAEVSDGRRRSRSRSSPSTARAVRSPAGTRRGRPASSPGPPRRAWRIVASHHTLVVA